MVSLHHLVRYDRGLAEQEAVGRESLSCRELALCGGRIMKNKKNGAWHRFRISDLFSVPTLNQQT